MKTINAIIAQVITLSLVISTQAQGTFQNLNFEQAQPISANNPSDPYLVTAASALPDWNVSIGGVSTTQVLLNAESTGAASVAIFGPGWTNLPSVIDGNYSVYLQAFFVTEGNVSISQTGMIPANAQSLQFKAWSGYPNGVFSVSFAGNSLSPVVLSSGQTASGQTYDVYGVNIARYAGQTGQLEFTAIDTTSPDETELDDITFSTQAVPEPSTIGLMAMGLTGWSIAGWRKLRRNFRL